MKKLFTLFAAMFLTCALAVNAQTPATTTAKPATPAAAKKPSMMDKAKAAAAAMKAKMAAKKAPAPAPAPAAKPVVSPASAAKPASTVKAKPAAGPAPLIKMVNGKPIHVKKDGTPDMRYKENRDAAAAAAKKKQ